MQKIRGARVTVTVVLWSEDMYMHEKECTKAIYDCLTRGSVINIGHAFLNPIYNVEMRSIRVNLCTGPGIQF